ncbi:hypothetical protein [Endozoicomonas sp. GU-1]|uniref:hypothetical protein n=1 Tax=Endozoicomonas sp. GU-1 TaxID=3009078 RepID=UPI0022B348C4|nr:hypothetical protein [Endozoicomonas sp. GU-1]WBA86535.1 hypothetical protein O3276_00290 [Endozoicomonas sp. GU-1]
MRLIQRLLVNGEPVEVIEDDVRLSLTSPGRATFRVKSGKPLAGPVEYIKGWQHDTDDRPVKVFWGFIDRSSTVGGNEQMIFCRELSAMLNRDLPMGLRKVSAADVLARIHKETGAQFVTNNQAHFSRISPYFHHVGGGYMAMDAIGQVFQIPNYIWQQQGDGKIYVGSWDNSRWADPKRHITIPDNWFTDHMAHNTASMTMIPTLRPGLKFNRGIITAVQLKQEKMVITWKKPSNAFS